MAKLPRFRPTVERLEDRRMLSVSVLPSAPVLGALSAPATVQSATAVAQPTSAVVSGTSQTLATTAPALSFDDSKLAPAGLESTVALPNLPVFKVTDYGAKGDGVHDDTAAIRAAIAAAKAKNGGIIYLPAGNYAVAPQATDAQKWGSIFKINSSNLVFIGDGPTKTHLLGYTLGLKNPATNWYVTGDSYSKIGRFTLFDVDSTNAAISNIQFRSLELKGNAGYTGDFTVGGNTQTGDGWDMTHKAILMGGAHTIDKVLVFNSTLDNWRGEILYGGGNLIGKVSAINCNIYGTNASAVSVSGDVLLNHVTIGGDAAGSDVYNGVEDFAMGTPQKTVVQDSHIICSSAGKAIHGNGIAYLGLDTSSLVVQGTEIRGNQFGILLSETAHNVTVNQDTFSNNSQSIITSILGQYPAYPTGFSDMTVSNSTFDHSGSVLLNQLYAGSTKPYNNLVLKGNTITNGHLLEGGFYGSTTSPWTGFVVDGNTLGAGASDILSYSGNNYAEWTNTNRTNPVAFGSAGVQVNDYSTTTNTTTVCPKTDLTVLNDNKTTGNRYVVINPSTLASYPAGFRTKFVNWSKSNWVLKADPTWNTFTSDQPVGPNGLTIQKNAQGLFALPPTWTATSNGDWSTGSSWSPTSPTSSLDAVVSTPRTVTVSSTQQAHALNVSGGGQVTVASGGNLTVSKEISVADGGINVLAGGTLALSELKKTATSASLKVDGGTLQSLASFTAAVPITVGAGGATVDTGSTNLVLGAGLVAGTGTGGLTKCGSGTLTLSSANTYKGSTNVSGGTLQVTNAAALPTGTGLTINSGTVVLDTGLNTAVKVAGLHLALPPHATTTASLAPAAAISEIASADVLPVASEAPGGTTAATPAALVTALGTAPVTAAPVVATTPATAAPVAAAASGRTEPVAPKRRTSGHPLTKPLKSPAASITSLPVNANTTTHRDAALAASRSWWLYHVVDSLAASRQHKGQAVSHKAVDQAITTLWK